MLTEVNQLKMNYTIEEGKVISMLAIKDFVPGSAIGAVTVGIQSVYAIITCPEQFKTNGQWDVTKLNRLMPALGKNKKDGYKYNRHVLKDFKVEKKDKYGRKNSINRINSNCMLAFLEEIKIIDVTSMKDTDMFFLVKDFDQIGQAFAEAAVDVQKDKSKTFSFGLNHFVNQEDVILEYRCFKAEEAVKIKRQKDNSFKILKNYNQEKVIKDLMGLVGNTIADVSADVLNDKIKPLLDSADKLAFKEGTAKAAANRKDDNGRKILESIFIAIKAYEKAVEELDKPSKVKMARLYRELIYSVVGNDVITWALAACHCFVGNNGIAIGRNMANINLVMEILPKEFIYCLCGEEALKLHVSYSNVELLEGAEFFTDHGQCFTYDEYGRPVKIFLEEEYTGPVIVKSSGAFPMYPEDVLIGDINTREVIIIKNPIIYDKYTGKVGEQFDYNIEAMQNKICNKGTIGFNKEANEIVSRDNQGVETVLGKKLLIKKGTGTNVTCRMIDYCEFGAVLFIKTE